MDLISQFSSVHTTGSIHPYLSTLVNYIHPVPFSGFDEAESKSTKVIRLKMSCILPLRSFNKRQILNFKTELKWSHMSLPSIIMIAEVSENKGISEKVTSVYTACNIWWIWSILTVSVLNGPLVAVVIVTDDKTIKYHKAGFKVQCCLFLKGAESCVVLAFWKKKLESKHWNPLLHVPCMYDMLCMSSAFNKHRRPTKSVGYFAQKSRLLFALN